MEGRPYSKNGDPGNYRGITLLSVVGRCFKVLNFYKAGVLHKGQAGFRLKRSCVIH